MHHLWLVMRTTLVQIRHSYFALCFTLVVQPDLHPDNFADQEGLMSC